VERLKGGRTIVLDDARSERSKTNMLKYSSRLIGISGTTEESAIMSYVYEWLRAHPKIVYSDGIRKPVDHRAKCIDEQGAYVRKKIHAQVLCDYFVKTNNKISFNFCIYFRTSNIFVGKFHKFRLNNF